MTHPPRGSILRHLPPLIPPPRQHPRLPPLPSHHLRPLYLQCLLPRRPLHILNSLCEIHPHHMGGGPRRQRIRAVAPDYITGTSLVTVTLT
ncbi:hypothetical protein KSP39_PZI017498 [Platanthera zijinensis]|uniref:Uncharacterized protein n=1 Tax=Platanthera zijinensis TaxID=2320716 RepID=A0AAP0B566_9ASPA